MHAGNGCCFGVAHSAALSIQQLTAPMLYLLLLPAGGAMQLCCCSGVGGGAVQPDCHPASDTGSAAGPGHRQAPGTGEAAEQQQQQVQQMQQ
jgi:hypothetical protein